MKKIYLIIILLTNITLANAQEEIDYVDTIAQDACDCIKKVKENKSDLTKEDLGGCLLLSAKEYKEQLVKDYDLNLEALDGESGEKLGKAIGSRMAFICPTLVASLGNISNKNKIEEFEIFGKVKSIKEEAIVILELKTDEGKTEKLFWLSFVDSSFDLQNNYSELQDKSVEATYVNQEIFDPRINEYRKVKVLTTLSVK